MQDREYQEKQISETVDAIEKHRAIIVQLPTGGGKTIEFARIIKKFLNNHIDIEFGPALILVHREELLYQAEKAVKSVLGFDPCLITSGTSRYWISRCYIGMVESTLSRLHLIIDPSLIIIDEAHLQNFTKVHRCFPYAKIIGFSATPLSVSKRDPLKNYYKNIITGPTIKELINLGHLAQNITRAPKLSVDASQFAFDRLKGDYNERQMSEVYSMQTNITNVVDKYFQFCARKKTLIFNVTIEHSKKVNDCFNACGYPAKHLDSSCKDRKEIFKWFKETPGAILNSVMIPTMGFDEPTVESIILNYSTMSLVKFVQTCGRGSRVIDEYFIDKFQAYYPYMLKEKTHFDIIDLGQNWRRFGDWNDDRDWKYIFWNPDEPGDGVAPVKTCPSCEALVHAAIRVCPYCQWEFQKKVVKQMDMEEMILVTKGVNLKELNDKSEKKYKYYPFFELAVDIVDTMFFIHGKQPSQMIVDRFFRTYYGLCCQWFDKTLAGKEDEMESIEDSGWHINKARSNFNSLIQRKTKDGKTVKDYNSRDIINGTDTIKTQEQSWNKYKEANL